MFHYRCRHSIHTRSICTTEVQNVNLAITIPFSPSQNFIKISEYYITPKLDGLDQTPRDSEVTHVST